MSEWKYRCNRCSHVFDEKEVWRGKLQAKEMRHCPKCKGLEKSLSIVKVKGETK
jgi:NAD-dependent SIR2 family protein deacetylase